MKPLKYGLLMCVASVVWMMRVAHAADTSPAEQLTYWIQQAAAPANAQRGEQWFQAKHGGEWSCASCHGAPPNRTGKHANTGKAIPPLAPAFNAKSLTDTQKINKWFRRNCKDVLSRECSPQEKADVLAYWLGLKP